MIQLVLTTFPSAEQAKKTVQQLVKARLAACGTLFPGATSIYTWNGNVEEHQECLLILKTTTDCAKKLQIEIRRMHPYEVPEILLCKVHSYLAAYAQWINHSCEKDRSACRKE